MTTIEPETAPPTPSSDVWPVWTDLVDNWRATDAHWLRDRAIQLFPDASTRTTVLQGVALLAGMLSYIATGSVAGGPDFWNGSAWESVRYPNLNVISDATSVTLRRQGAGSGVQLINDGSVNTVKNVVGTGGIGYVGDQTGISLHIGAKTVKLATDANGLTVDSPVSVTGGLTTTGAISAPSITVPTITSTGTITASAVNATSLAASGAVSGATVTGGDVLLGSAPPYGTIKHRSGGTSQIGVGSDSTVSILGTTLTIGTSAAQQTLNVNGIANFNYAVNFVGRPVLAMPSTVATWVAGIYAVSGNVAPTQNCPDGTIYVTY